MMTRTLTFFNNSLQESLYGFHLGTNAHHVPCKRTALQKVISQRPCPSLDLTEGWPGLGRAAARCYGSLPSGRAARAGVTPGPYALLRSREGAARGSCPSGAHRWRRAAGTPLPAADLPAATPPARPGAAARRSQWRGRCQPRPARRRAGEGCGTRGGREGGEES